MDSTKAPLTTNRSMPPATVIPELAYPDMRAGAEWLCRAFGFVERLRIGDHRAQLVYGSGSVIVTGQQGAPPEGASASHAIMVRVADVDSHYEQARATGATILSTPNAALWRAPVHCRRPGRPSLDLLAERRRRGPGRMGRRAAELDVVERFFKSGRDAQGWHAGARLPQLIETGSRHASPLRRCRLRRPRFAAPRLPHRAGRAGLACRSEVAAAP